MFHLQNSETVFVGRRGQDHLTVVSINYRPTGPLLTPLPFTDSAMRTMNLLWRNDAHTYIRSSFGLKYRDLAIWQNPAIYSIADIAIWISTTSTDYVISGVAVD